MGTLDGFTCLSVLLLFHHCATVTMSRREWRCAKFGLIQIHCLLNSACLIPRFRDSKAPRWSPRLVTFGFQLSALVMIAARLSDTQRPSFGSVEIKFEYIIKDDPFGARVRSRDRSPRVVVSPVGLRKLAQLRPLVTCLARRKPVRASEKLILPCCVH